MDEQQKYRFVTGQADAKQLAEINAMADAGYKVTHMACHPKDGMVLVLMESSSELS
jgi:hypothetical protein